MGNRALSVNKVQGLISERGLQWRAKPNWLTQVSQLEREALLLPEMPAVRVQAVPKPMPPLPPAPSRFDWRDVEGKSYITPVRNQDGRGTCVAFANTAAMESCVLKSQPLKPNEVDLSERVLADCNPGYPASVWNFLREIGLPPEQCFTWTAQAPTPGWQQLTYRAMQETYFGVESPLSLEEFKRLLTHRGPLITGMNIPNDFFSYAGGVYTASVRDLAGFHLLQIVGYDDGAKCFIGKNSWGTGWGEEGFVRIAYSEFGKGTATDFGRLTTVFTGIVPPRRRSLTVPITLKTQKGHSVTVVNGGGLGGPNTSPRAVALHTDATTPGPWETFQLQWLDGMWCTLQTENGHYLTAVNGGGIGGPNDSTCPVHTDATWSLGWEQLTLNYDAVTKTATLQTPDGHFLTAVNGGGIGGPDSAPFHTDATAVGPWEKFQAVVGSADQQYRPTPQAMYRLRAKHSGKVLEIGGSATKDGARANQWDACNGANQHWSFTEQAGGVYSLRAAHSGRILDVSGASKSNGAAVQQWHDISGDNQKWRLLPQPDGTFVIQAVHSGQVLDVSARAIGNGALVQQWPWLNGDNQKWWIVQV